MIWSSPLYTRGRYQASFASSFETHDEFTSSKFSYNRSQNLNRPGPSLVDESTWTVAGRGKSGFAVYCDLYIWRLNCNEDVWKYLRPSAFAYLFLSCMYMLGARPNRVIVIHLQEPFNMSWGHFRLKLATRYAGKVSLVTQTLQYELISQLYALDCMQLTILRRLPVDKKHKPFWKYVLSDLLPHLARIVPYHVSPFSGLEVKGRWDGSVRMHSPGTWGHIGLTMLPLHSHNKTQVTIWIPDSRFSRSWFFDCSLDFDNNNKKKKQ
jgi:hypothetical protein